MNMFGLPIWTVTVDHKAGKELVMKSNLADMKLTIKRRPNIFVEFMKHKETLFLLDTKFNANVIKADLKTVLHMPTGSIFCTSRSAFAGCYNQWNGDFNIHVDLKNKNVFLNKFSINADIKKDSESQFEYEMSTMVSPYVMKMKAPSILPMVFDDPRRQTLEVTVDHKPGQMLHIITNAPEMSSFKVTTNGVQRVLELNGEERVIVDYTKADKKFKQVLHLPNGEQVTITLDWATWEPMNNKVNMHIETPTRKLNFNTNYDLTNIKAGRMMVRFHGENPLVGKFDFMRNGNWRVDANQIDAQWNGKANFAKGPLAVFSPIDTTSTLNFDFGSMETGGLMPTRLMPSGMEKPISPRVNLVFSPPLTLHPPSTLTLAAWSSMPTLTRSLLVRSGASVFLRTRSTFQVADREKTSAFFSAQNKKYKKICTWYKNHKNLIYYSV